MHGGWLQGYVQKSMERMVTGADVIIAVVSKGYVVSENCARELALARAHNIRVLPVNVELSHDEWMGQGLKTMRNVCGPTLCVVCSVWVIVVCSLFCVGQSCK